MKKVKKVKGPVRETEEIVKETVIKKSDGSPSEEEIDRLIEKVSGNITLTGNVYNDFTKLKPLIESSSGYEKEIYETLMAGVKKKTRQITNPIGLHSIKKSLERQVSFLEGLSPKEIDKATKETEFEGIKKGELIEKVRKFRQNRYDLVEERNNLVKELIVDETISKDEFDEKAMKGTIKIREHGRKTDPFKVLNVKNYEIDYKKENEEE